MKYIIILFALIGSVQADVLGTLNVQGGQVVLTDQKCTETTGAAVFIGSDGHFISGCWVLNEELRKVFIVFEDGDKQAYDIGNFTPGEKYRNQPEPKKKPHEIETSF